MRRLGLIGILVLLMIVASMGLWGAPKTVLAVNSTTVYPASDAHVYVTDADWDGARDAVTGTLVNGNQIAVGHEEITFPNDTIYRAFLCFDTSGLPDDAEVTAVEFHYYVHSAEDTNAVRQKFYVIHSSGSYPSNPVVAGDYDITHYSTTPNGGSSEYFDTATDDTWYSLVGNSDFRGWVSTTSVTRIALVGTADLTDVDPSGTDGFMEIDSEATANDPHLYIEYIDLPTVTSSAATSVGTNTATANGNITSLGGDTGCDYRGVVYGTSSLADPGNTWPSGYDYYGAVGPSSYGTGAYTYDISGLDTDTVYYYRMFVHNTAGYDYSDDQQTFHTLENPAITTSAASSITNTTARLNGNVTNAGYPNPTVTVYWGDNDGGETPGSWDYSSAPTSPAQPQGVAAFYKDVTSLSPGVTYYFRARAVNDAATVWAAPTLSFATTDIYPTVTTQAASGTDNDSTTLNGNITSVGGDPTCDYRGFCWDTLHHDDPGDVSPASCGYDGPPGTGYYTYSGSFGTGAFTYDLTGLAADTTYYSRAYAHNSSGWAYGGEVTFSTAGPPSVSSMAASGTTETTTYFNGNITDTNEATVTSRGFDYGLTGAYGSSWTEAGSFGTGAYASTEISGLTPGTKYYFRAKAQNTYGWGYGSQLTVTTLPEPPTNLNSGTMTYTTVEVTWTAGVHAAQTMLRYSTTGYPASPAGGTEAYFNTGTSVTVDTLTPGATYYFKAWSWVSGSDVWSSSGAQLTLSLPIPSPESLKAKAVDAHTINLWWLVPDNMTEVPTVSTIIHYKVGDYPANPPADTEVYNETTGDEGVKNYVWTTALAGTPYFFGLWFFNSSDNTYSDPVYAACTTPAGYSDPTNPGGSGYFETPTDTSQDDNPIAPTLAYGADIWGMEHGIIWAIFAMLVAILVGMGFAIYTKSGVITTFAMLAVMVSAGTMDVLSYWLCIPFALLGFALTWVAARSYG